MGRLWNAVQTQTWMRGHGGQTAHAEWQSVCNRHGAVYGRTSAGAAPGRPAVQRIACGTVLRMWVWEWEWWCVVCGVLLVHGGMGAWGQGCTAALLHCCKASQAALAGGGLCCAPVSVPGAVLALLNIFVVSAFSRPVRFYSPLSLCCCPGPIASHRRPTHARRSSPLARLPIPSHLEKHRPRHSTWH